MDMKFDWDKTIEIGIPEIDEQHKELFRITRDIEQLIMTQARNLTNIQILERLCDIREYVTYHFYTEENIIGSTIPSELEQHKAQHGAFVGKINAIDCDALVADPTTEFKKIKKEIQDWLFEHILIEDRKIRTDR